MRLVSVVTSTRPPLSTVWLIWPTKSSTCPVAGRSTMSGSMSPVGRMICSTVFWLNPSSYAPGVALT